MKRLLSLFGLVCLLAHTGCQKLSSNLAERAFERAEKKVGEGDFKGAIIDYEEALAPGPRAAEVHYRLAVLYADKLKIPASALHHFQRSLELNSNGARAKELQAFIKEAEFRLRTSLSPTAAMSQAEIVRLKNDNLTLRKQLAEIKSRPRSQDVSATGPVPTPGPPPPGSRTYVVQAGDTLASISRKFYKSSVHWKDIQDANFNALNGTNKLKPGQTLIIPKAGTP